MNDVIAPGRYARALFELAEKEDLLAGMEADLLALVAALKAEPKIGLLMANPTLTNDEKYALILKVFPKKRSGLLERFLRVLIDKKRFALLPDIQKIFHDRFERKQGVQEVEVLSAIPLSEKFREKLRTVLSQRLRDAASVQNAESRAEIRLIPKIDHDLLGGFVLRFNGKEIDCSFKNRLEEIQQQLLSPVEEGTV
ncbi:MAG TPA: ATP synthase F1 subunit delta [Candidatus Omnitrophota bacterium]|nr:ATP synthase F1 subunit delta [Candidatus Omnitrophota bacterium]HRY85416.1 ATP synthase F1 subunit delta [Candidatus Omnitrophota bacterium]